MFGLSLDPFSRSPALPELLFSGFEAEADYECAPGTGIIKSTRIGAE